MSPDPVAPLTPAELAALDQALPAARQGVSMMKTAYVAAIHAHGQLTARGHMVAAMRAAGFDIDDLYVMAVALMDGYLVTQSIASIADAFIQAPLRSQYHRLYEAVLLARETKEAHL